MNIYTPRYLKVFDPVTRQWRYFRQIGNLYGSGSAGVRWEKTLVGWLTSSDVGFRQGCNERSAFYHEGRGIRLLTYSDDMFCRGKLSQVKWFFKSLGERFSIKEPVYLSKNSMLDHLGMTNQEEMTLARGMPSNLGARGPMLLKCQRRH